MSRLKISYALRFNGIVHPNSGSQYCLLDIKIRYIYGVWGLGATLTRAKLYICWEIVIILGILAVLSMAASGSASYFHVLARAFPLERGHALLCFLSQAAFGSHKYPTCFEPFGLVTLTLTIMAPIPPIFDTPPPTPVTEAL